LNFAVNAEPSYAPAGFGEWTAQYVACQYSPTYEVVDPGEVSWYMNKLAMSVQDVLTDASARRWLGRALNVRFFVFGVIQQTASFNVSTHLVDAETGVKQGTAQIHVKDPNELKLRAPELARQTLQNPAGQARLRGEAKANEAQLNEARQLLKAGKAAQAMQVCQVALKQHPDNVAMRVLLQQAELQVQQQNLEATRRQEAERASVQAARVQQEQKKLAEQARQSRARAEQEAKKRGEAARRAQEQQTKRAHDQLLARGRQALGQAQYSEAVQFLESAQALKPSPETKQVLAEARAQAAKAARDNAAKEKVRMAAEQRQQEAAAADKARARVAAERRRKAAELQALRKAQEEHNQANKSNAAASTEAPRREKVGQRAAELQKKPDIKRPLTGSPSNKGPAYAEAMTRGRNALAAKHYDEAIQAFSEAGRLRPNDPDAAALRGQAVSLRAAAQSKTAGNDERKRLEEQHRFNEFIHLMAQGQAEMDADHYENAVKAYAAAVKLEPDQAGAVKSLKDAQQALEASRRPPVKPGPLSKPGPKVEQPTNLLAPMPSGQPQVRSVAPPPSAKPEVNAVVPPPPPPSVKPQPQPGTPSVPPTPQPRPAALAPGQPQPRPPVVNAQAEYNKLMQLAAAAEKQQKFVEAIQAYQMALIAVPNDFRATHAKKVAEYQLHMSQGQKAMAFQHYPDASREFEAALKLFPGNPAATSALQKARQGGR
jgi:colicin import membrane protein